MTEKIRYVMYYSNGERSEYGSSVSLPIKRRNSSLWTRPIQALVRQLTAHSIPSTNSTPSSTTAPAAGAQFQPGYMTKRRSAEFAEIFKIFDKSDDGFLEIELLPSWHQPATGTATYRSKRPLTTLPAGKRDVSRGTNSATA
jgi:hypothetical protein